jgi:hypothetical protein
MPKAEKCRQKENPALETPGEVNLTAEVNDRP